MNIANNSVLQTIAGTDPQVAVAYSAAAFAAVLASLAVVFTLLAVVVAVEKLFQHLKKGGSTKQR